MKFVIARTVAAICVSIGSATAGPILYQLTDLGSMGSTAAANGINASGQTSATMSDRFGNFNAFSSTTNLTASGTDALAAGINASGQVVGTTYRGDTSYATVWTNGTSQDLLAGSYGMAINDKGQVTGSDASGKAFLYTNGTTVNLGTFAGGTFSSGYAINESGTVAGYGDTSSGAMAAFIWTAGGGMKKIGTLGGASSYAAGLNESGQVTGSAQTRAGYLHAFVFTGGSLTDLGTLGGTSSFGYGINDSGAVVGYSVTAGGQVHAFLYQGGVMYDLNSLLAVSGWELTAAYGINNSGQIAGTALFDGVEHAVRLDPMALVAPALSSSASVPEPATWMLVLAGASALLYRAVKSRVK